MTSTPDTPQDENKVQTFQTDATMPRSGEFARDIVREYYAGLFRFGFASVGSTEAARQAALHALAAASHDRNALAAGGRLWLYNNTLREFRHLRSRQAHIPNAAPSTGPLKNYETALHKLIDRWDDRERETAVLYYLLRWPAAEIAALLKVSAGAIQAQVDLFRGAFAALPKAAPTPDDTPATQRIHAPDVAPLNPDEARAAAYLQSLWPAPQLTDNDVTALAAQVDALVAGTARPRSLLAVYWWIWVVVSLLLVAVIAGAGAVIWNLWQKQAAPGAAVSPTVPAAFVQPTAFPPVPQTPLLSRQSTSADIIERWQESRNLWHSVTIDVQTVDYGTQSYIGPARRYRSQGWALQPDSGIQLTGLLSQPAGQVNLVGGGRIFTRSYVSGRSSSQVWSPQVNALLPDDPLRSMVFPATSQWAQRQGSFWWAGSSKMLGRSVEIFDWLNHLNEPEARLYLDAQTGIIMREQIYTGEGFELLRRESVVTELIFERHEPPPALIVAAQQSQTQESETDSGFLPRQATPTPAMEITARAALAQAPSPPGMDPSRSRLIFQFADDPAISERLVNTADAPAQLFADGYYLGEARFALPWALRCTRSQDGSRLAFNTATDGASAPDDGLHWFNLSEPGRVYQPMPGFHTDAFAFSPDARSLAAVGFYDLPGDEPDKHKDGLYRVDLATGEPEQLIEVHEASSLVWSPDGKFLALIGRLPDEDQPAVLVINVGARMVIHQGDPGRASAPLPADSPIRRWNVPFPVSMGDLEVCAAPRP